MRRGETDLEQVELAAARVVIVDVDEAGHHDPGTGVDDHLARLRLRSAPVDDGHDHRSLDHHRGVNEDPIGGVGGEDRGVVDDGPPGCTALAHKPTRWPSTSRNSRPARSGDCRQRPM